MREPTHKQGPAGAVSRNYRLDLAYDGTAYCGWQRQAEGCTLQQELEEALGKLMGARVVTYGSGRTDRGVHACRLVVVCN